MDRPVDRPKSAARRARVAVINSHPIQHFAPLWAEVARQGEVTLKVLYCSDWGAKEYTDPGFGKTFRWDVDLLSGYDHEMLPIARRPSRMGFWEVDNPSVGRALGAFGPDVLVLFGYAMLTNWRALAWARLHGVRVLVLSDSELKHARPLLAKLAKEVVVRAFLAQTDGAMPIGDCNAAYYRHYGLPDAVLYGCPIPVDGARFLAFVGDARRARAEVRSALGIDEGDFVFASVGKYIDRKRHADVLRAFLALPAGVRARSRALLIGDGPLRPELEALAARAGGRVVLAGFVNQSRMPAYFAASDALCVASDFDPHPLVVTEALFLGLPIIASDKVGCIGPDDTVRDGVNGLVYPCGDLGALAAAMRGLAEDSSRYAAFAAQSRRIAGSQDTPTAARRFALAVERAASAPAASLAERARRLIPLPRAPLSA